MLAYVRAIVSDWQNPPRVQLCRWMNQNWGTDSEALRAYCNDAHNGRRGDSVDFLTSTIPPLPIYMYLSFRFPQLKLTVEYDDYMDTGGLVRLIFEKGQQVRREEFLFESSEAQRVFQSFESLKNQSDSPP